MNTIHCEHSDTRVELLPADSPHYGREVCVNCGQHLRFTPKRETIERRRVTAYRVAKMLMLPNLSPWERKFLCSVAAQRKFSPKQTGVLQRLWTEHFGGQS